MRALNDRGRLARGFTLVEVLIALLILGLGILGSAALQLKALQATHAAYQRSLVNLFAMDAVERFWLEAAQGSVQGDWVADWVRERDCSQPAVATQVCLPELHLEWSASGRTYALQLSWSESRWAADVSSGQEHLHYQFELPWAPGGG